MNDCDQSSSIDVETWSGKHRRDENFPVGSLLIRREYREPMHCYYAFARNADDIADSAALSAEQKIARLNIMQDVLLGQREVGSRSAAALRASLVKSGVTPAHATDLLIAFRRDATVLRYATSEELYDYCRYSAMPVGRYVLDLHGESRDCYAASDALCTSLQILNHLQDCAKDLVQLDRCYMPQMLLEQFGSSVNDLRQPLETTALRRVFATLLEHIDALNQAASALPRAVRDRRLRLETALIQSLAKRLTKRLKKMDMLASDVKLTKSDVALSLLQSVTYTR